MRILFIALISLLASQPVYSEENLPYEPMFDAFFDQCVARLAANRPPEPGSSDPFPDAPELEFQKESPGNNWVDREANVILQWGKRTSQELDFCVVSWLSIIAEDQDNNSDVVKAISEFDNWADMQIRSGNYAEIIRCREPSGSYRRTLDSKFSRTLPVRIAFHWQTDTGFILHIASEVGSDEVPPSCKLPPST
ncbi:hypothetical protein [Leisingera sp. F5]|uniref:hypothetical protein n=1 Tax=Leisingera sp. F5 TaxID=1813816 RepID=UPI000AB5A90E|nr:hypothetical protein [Leisingera sp. F5]